MPILSQSGCFRSEHSHFPLLVLIGSAALVLLATANAAGFVIEASVIAGGGGHVSSAGGCLQLDTSIGQGTAGLSAGGPFSMRAGFSPAVSRRTDALFNNGFQECL